jgi:hypothetical protein
VPVTIYKQRTLKNNVLKLPLLKTQEVNNFEDENEKNSKSLSKSRNKFKGMQFDKYSPRKTSENKNLSMELTYLNNTSRTNNSNEKNGINFKRLTGRNNVSAFGTNTMFNIPPPNHYSPKYDFTQTKMTSCI